MKFDANGKKIVIKKGKSLSEIFLDRVIVDADVIAKYLKVNIPYIKLKNGSGGDYTKSSNQMRIGFGDGTYNSQTRSIIIHEMLHHKGYEHGRVMGFSFMSHSDHDSLSPMLSAKIFQ